MVEGPNIRNAKMAEYSPDLKAKVVAALLEGQSVTSVAKEYKIPKGTVSGWKSRIAEPSLESAGSTESGTQKSNKIGDLVTEYLEANLEALREQTRVFSDPKWLRTQDASSLAVLHGVMTDKAVRLIEAFAKIED